MARCSKKVGSGYHVGIGRNKRGRFCPLKRGGCHRDSALAGAIKRGLKRTAKGRFCG